MTNLTRSPRYISEELIKKQLPRQRSRAENIERGIRDFTEAMNSPKYNPREGARAASTRSFGAPTAPTAPTAPRPPVQNNPGQMRDPAMRQAPTDRTRSAAPFAGPEVGRDTSYDAMGNRATSFSQRGGGTVTQADVRNAGFDRGTLSAVSSPSAQENQAALERMRRSHAAYVANNPEYSRSARETALATLNELNNAERGRANTAQLARQNDIAARNSQIRAAETSFDQRVTLNEQIRQNQEALREEVGSFVTNQDNQPDTQAAGDIIGFLTANTQYINKAMQDIARRNPAIADSMPNLSSDLTQWPTGVRAIMANAARDYLRSDERYGDWFSDPVGFDSFIQRYLSR